MGQGGQETGLWPKAGGGRKLTQYLREHPVALSLKRTLSGPWVLSAGWAREAMQSPQDFGGLGVGPADLGSPTVLPLSRPSHSAACRSHPCWLRISSTCESKAGILQLLCSL